MAPTFLIILLQLCVLTSITCNAKLPKLCNPKLPKFSNILIFGDSTLDTGNNNYITTLLKANHPPYGLNFPGNRPTGRFSDGKLIPDFIASFLNIKETVPPFLDPTLSDDDLRTGVNFASAGSGYDDLTTVVTGAIPVSKQPEYLRNYIGRLKKLVGEEEALRIIKGSLVVISAGTNDFVINFYDIPTKKLEYNISGYQDFLQDKLQKFVKELYNLGCRTMVIAGVPPIGCLPIQMTARLELPKKGKKCVEEQNSDAISFNKKLSSLLPQLQASLPGSKILYADIYEPLLDMINNPQKNRFVETSKGCCGTGLLEAGPICNTLSPICTNPSQHVFFDSIHPSQATYLLLADRLFKEIIATLSKNGEH